MDNFAPAQLRLGIGIAGSGDYDFQLCRFYDFSGIFSVLVYTRGRVKSKLMQVCVTINSIYAAGAAVIIGLAVSGFVNG